LVVRIVVISRESVAKSVNLSPVFENETIEAVAITIEESLYRSLVLAPVQ
jgi:hypothetical protein